MNFNVILTKTAKKQLIQLDNISINKLTKTYKKIDTDGVDGLNIKPIKGTKKLYEIKTDNLRSLFTYKEGQIILVGVIFVKKTQKTPQKFIDTAKKELELF